MLASLRPRTSTDRRHKCSTFNNAALVKGSSRREVEDRHEGENRNECPAARSTVGSLDIAGREVAGNNRYQSQQRTWGLGLCREHRRQGATHLWLMLSATQSVSLCTRMKN
jgi:hypothetical protein